MIALREKGGESTGVTKNSNIYNFASPNSNYDYTGAGRSAAKEMSNASFLGSHKRQLTPLINPGVSNSLERRFSNVSPKNLR